MMSLLLLLSTGLFLGALHAFEPDHLVSVSSFISKHSSSKTNYGLLWGLGHSVSLLIATLLVILLKVTFPSWFFEVIIGVVLIVLGLRLLLKKSVGNSHHQFAIGLLHGLAGTATLVVLIASMSSSILQSILFVFIFGAGSIMGMSLVSLSLSTVLKKYSFLLAKSFTLVVAISSVGIGLYKLIIIAW